MKDLDPNNHQVNVGSGPNARDGVGWRTALQKINDVFEFLDDKKVSVEGDTITGHVVGSNNYNDSSSNFVTVDDLSIKLDENRESEEYIDPILSGNAQIENQLSQNPNQTSSLLSQTDIEDVILVPYAPLADPSLTGNATLDNSAIINQDALDSTLSDYATLDAPSLTGDATLDDSAVINQDALENYAAPIENPNFTESASVEGNALVTQNALDDQLADYAPLNNTADFQETPSVNGNNIITEDTFSEQITKSMIESYVITILEEQGLISQS